ncbi:hypothetical protein LTR66_007438 [Elasticomyces elasticus]|nr:hypothetical protein LTR66_007438 [Elasticomyces elasticus]KAK5009189.1 hypothetical protein LTR28_002231 [Elasticomyces elasticus]
MENDPSTPPRSHAVSSAATNNFSPPAVPHNTPHGSDAQSVVSRLMNADEVDRHLEIRSAEAGLPFGAPTLEPPPTEAPSEAVMEELEIGLDDLDILSDSSTAVVSLEHDEQETPAEATAADTRIGFNTEVAGHDGVTEHSTWVDSVTEDLSYMLVRLGQAATDDHLRDPSKSVEQHYSRRLAEVIKNGPVTFDHSFL